MDGYIMLFFLYWLNYFLVKGLEVNKYIVYIIKKKFEVCVKFIFFVYIDINEIIFVYEKVIIRLVIEIGSEWYLKNVVRFLVGCILFVVEEVWILGIWSIRLYNIVKIEDIIVMVKIVVWFKVFVNVKFINGFIIIVKFINVV